MGAPEDGVLVNGDSGNDIELFAVPGVRGTMVSNAHPELREWVEAHASPNIFQASSRHMHWCPCTMHDAMWAYHAHQKPELLLAQSNVATVYCGSLLTEGARKGAV